MRVYLQGLTALAYYRNGAAATEVERCRLEVRSMDDATSSRSAIVDMGIWRLGIGEPSVDHPFEVLIRCAEQRTRSKAVHARIWAATVPPTAFRTVRKNIYVSSPEFMFLQMATRLDVPELAALGMELCGAYRREVRLPRPGTEGFGHVTAYDQRPLTTLKRLRGFLSSVDQAPGRTRALKALKYVLPNSASPMETALCLLLCLPQRLGGYALPKPTLNPSIKLSRAGRRHTLRKSAKPDLYWKDAQLDLEYNSDEFHDGGRRANDSMRRKALERMHVEVIELTRDELFSVELLHATVLRIAKRMGKRIRNGQGDDFAERRAALRATLLVDGSDVSQKDFENAYMKDEDLVVSDYDAAPFDAQDWDIWVDQDPIDEGWMGEEEAWDETEAWDGIDWEAELIDVDDEDSDATELDAIEEY